MPICVIYMYKMVKIRWCEDNVEKKIVILPKIYVLQIL